MAGITPPFVPSTAYAPAFGTPRQFIESGDYIDADSATIATVTPTVNTLRVAPIVVPSTLTIDRIGLEITVAGGAGSVVRLGLYKDSTVHPGFPGALSFEAGSTIDGTSVSYQEVTISKTLVAGLYWLAAVAQVGTAPTVRSTQSYSMPQHFKAGTDVSNAGWFTSGVTGAMPDPWPDAAPTSAKLLGNVPRVVLRVV